MRPAALFHGLDKTTPALLAPGLRAPGALPVAPRGGAADQSRPRGASRLPLFDRSAQGAHRRGPGAMSGIYWFASYPKSGNTWLRALLTNYRHGGDESVSLDELARQRDGRAA